MRTSLLDLVQTTTDGFATQTDNAPKLLCVFLTGKGAFALSFDVWAECTSDVCVTMKARARQQVTCVA